MSILRARIEQQERRIERLRCLIDRAEAIRDGLRERETGINVKAWQRKLARGFAEQYGNPRLLGVRT